MHFRVRLESDLEECVRLAETVHVSDGYPIRLPEDVRSFLSTDEGLAAWVAEREGEIVGHVALHRRSHPAMLRMASDALGQPEDHLAVIARLLVAPHVRRQGLGRALLAVAASEARARGLWPVLDVVATSPAAVRLYEESGWRQAGQVTFHFPDGGSVEEFVYLGPA